MKIKKPHLKKIINESLNKNLIIESPMFSGLLLQNFLNQKKQHILKLHRKAFDIAIENFDLDPHRDAFRHILGYGFLVHYINSKFLGKVIGEFVEMKGAINSFLQGGPFDSGWAMDSANNNIGFELGSKHKTHDQILKSAFKIVDSGNFFIEDGKTLYRDSTKDVRPPASKHGNYDEHKYIKQRNKYTQ